MIAIVNKSDPLEYSILYNTSESQALAHHAAAFGICEKVIFNTPTSSINDMIFCRVISKKNLQKFLKNYCNL